MAKTYEPIATLTGTGSSDTLSFTSIPATYTDLVIVLNGSLSAGANVRMTFNNDSTTKYSMTVLVGDGTSASSYRDNDQPFLQYIGFSDTAMATVIGSVMNYSNTTTNKTYLQRQSKASAQAQSAVGLYRSTSAINRLDIFTSNTATWSTATTVTLYGIKAA
jgi:hypothetical protein